MYHTQLVPTRFEWRYGGTQVHVCGSFTGWQEMVPMTVEPAPAGGGGAAGGAAGAVHSVTINIPPGYHQYKFMVDNEWCHDEAQPYMPSPLGPPNNWLHVNPPSEPAVADSGGPGVTPALLVPGAAQPASPSGAHGGAMDVDMAHGSTGGGAAGAGAGAGAGAPGQGPSAAAGGLLGGSQGSLGSLGVGSPMVASGMSEAALATNRQMLHQFLEHHAVFETLPDSGKVVVLDTRVPLAEAFLAFHEQSITAAPLWDSMLQAFVGMMTASDFIRIVRDFHANSHTLSWEQVENLSIAEWRAKHAQQGEAAGAGQAAGGAAAGAPPPLVSVAPDDRLSHAARMITQSGHSTLPVLAGDELSSVHCLHLVALPGVLATVAKHFRMVTRSLPLFAQPLGVLPIGTWVAARRPRGAKERDLATVREDAPLSATLNLLLEANVSAVPVVDENGRLRNVYSRKDVTALAKGRLYKRVLANTPLVQVLAYLDGSDGTQQQQGGAESSSGDSARCQTCTRADTLRSVLERLSTPGVGRLVVLEEGTKAVEGVVSVSDVVNFLLM
eukprot:PRCOL_00002888-RA